MGGVGMNL